MAESPAEPAHSSCKPSVGEDRPSVPRWLAVLLPLAVAAVTLVAFAPALDNGFVNWDDDKLLVDNISWRGLGPPQLRWMFTRGLLGHYHPLTWLTFAIDYRVWGGLEPRGFHLTSMVFHALNAVWFYLLARVLLRTAMPRRGRHGEAALCLGAALAALLFAVHPLRVESVAWVTERRDVVSTFFLIPCLLCYLRYAADRESGTVWYVASVALLVLSLLSKAWGITLPALLLVLDFYPLRRVRWGLRHLVSEGAFKAYLDKIPFALPALWAAYLAAKAQSAGEVMKPLHEYGLLERLAQSVYGLAFYVGKTLIPTGLAPIYEIPVEMNPFAGRFLVAAAAVVALTAALIALRKRWPAGLTLWVCYGVILLPVMGITQSGPQLVADRYSYLSCLTWALLGGAALIRAVTIRANGWPGRRRRTVAGVAAVGVVALLATLTWRQTQVWRTSRSLWEHTLRIDPESWNAHVNLGVLYQDQGELDEALRHQHAALAIKADLGAALVNISSILLEQGKTSEALEYALRARDLDSPEPGVLRQEAVLFYHLGRIQDATDAYRALIVATPRDPQPLWDLAVIFHTKGDQEGAVAYLEEAVALIEGSGLVNAGNARTSREGQVYIQACSKLRDHYRQRGDQARAARYRDKLRALGLGG